MLDIDLGPVDIDDARAIAHSHAPVAQPRGHRGHRGRDRPVVLFSPGGLHRRGDARRPPHRRGRHPRRHHGPRPPASVTGTPRPPRPATRGARRPELAPLLANHRGWKLDISLIGSEHGSFGDVQSLAPQIADVLDLPMTPFEPLIGTIDPARSLEAQRAYLRAFFDLHLRGPRDRPARPPVTGVPRGPFVE